jgi:hypothetical protein
MKAHCWALTALLLCIAAQARAAETLGEIASFAEKICNQSIGGGETSTVIEANLSGDANGLARALGISVGAGGLIKQDGSHYDGIPRDKLPSSIPTPAQCKFELAKVLIAERDSLTQSKPVPPGCDPRISTFQFTPGGFLYTGLTGVSLGDNVASAVQRLNQCGATYHIEKDAPRMQRVEVVVSGGLLTGINYTTLDAKIVTVGFLLSAAADHRELRAAARARFGAPDFRNVYGIFHYDVWNITPSTQLSIFESGGSTILQQ